MKTKMGRAVGGITALALSTLSVMWTPTNSVAANLAVSTTGFRSIASSDLLVLGPVEQVDARTLEIRVLGQTAVVPAVQRGIVSEDLVGRVVAIHGTINADGSLKVNEVAEMDSADYVPGATELYVKGVVRTVNHTNATATLGSLSIHYEGALHSLSTDDVVAGGVIAISGLKFEAFYADNGIAYPSKPMGQSGSDRLIGIKPAGQSGSDALGQSGSDRLIAIRPAGQSGSDALGQSGSDRLIPIRPAGQSGSDALGQSGSDRLIPIRPAGQSGSDALGQSGSDRLIAIKPAGQSGSDALGQSGSDRLIAIRPAGQSGSD